MTVHLKFKIEYEECPVCKLHSVFQGMQPGDTIDVETASTNLIGHWNRSISTMHLQSFGGMELWNVLSVSGFKIKNKCQSSGYEQPTVRTRCQGMVPLNKGLRIRVKEHYNARYLRWQRDLNIFGAKAKAFLWKPYVKPDYKCVEFGGGSGYIAASLTCREKWMIEINPAGRKWAEEHLGLRTVASTSDLANNTFDMVLTTSVIEHVECPVCEFRALRNIMKPDAVIIVTSSGISPHMLKWKPDDINLHLHEYTAQDLGNSLIKAGFIIKNETLCRSEYMQ